MKKPFLSLVVPTIGREELLDRLLKSIASQTSRDFEVIIADQSINHSPIASLVNSYTKDLDIRHVQLSSKGASVSRNAGSKLAVGNVIGWPDDDCWYEPETVENVILEVKTNPHYDFFIGLPLHDQNVPINRWIPESKTTITNNASLTFCIEWCFFIKQDVFFESYGFDTSFGPGAGTPWSAGESADLCLRLLKDHKKGLYSPAIRVHHPMNLNFGSQAVKKARTYACGMGAVLNKNKISLWDRLFYLFSYLRAFFWSLIRFNMSGCILHINRIYGLLYGYFNYQSENKQILSEKP